MGYYLCLVYQYVLRTDYNQVNLLRSLSLLNIHPNLINVEADEITMTCTLSQSDLAKWRRLSLSELDSCYLFVYRYVMYIVHTEVHISHS